MRRRDGYALAGAFHIEHRRMKPSFLPTAFAVLVGLPLATAAQDAQRQAEVAIRGADVMPFSLKATKHIFTKTADGGMQRVVANSAADTAQVKLVREHLRDIQAQFLKGNFPGRRIFTARRCLDWQSSRPPRLGRLPSTTGM